MQSKRKSQVRGRLLALVAPGALALSATATPWAVEGATQAVRPLAGSSAPGCSPVHAGRLVSAPGADHFSTKARSIT